MARPRATVEHLEITGQLNHHSRYKGYGRDTTAPIPFNTEIKPKKGWKKEARELLKVSSEWLICSKVLRESDLPLLESMVGFYNDYLTFRDQRTNYQEQSDLSDFESVKTLEKLSKMEQSYFRQFDTLASRFGLTPLDRQRIIANIPKETEEESPIEALLRRANAL